MLEHPEIAWIERTGYPSWMQESDCDEEDDEEFFDEDEDDDAYCDYLYEERRERELFGNL